jgi:REP element-mobilizing transposase RayT
MVSTLGPACQMPFFKKLLLFERLCHKHDKIKIPKSLRNTVKNAILKEAEEIGQKVCAIAIWSNHVHIVVESVAV